MLNGSATPAATAATGSLLPHALPSAGTRIERPPQQPQQDGLDELRDRLLARERHIRLLENSAEAAEDVLTEWQAKYDRLWEAHRKLQKTNHSLEDKLLRIVDRFEADKNQMTRDLASQTQRLVQSKLSVQQLHDQNGELQSDLQLALNLLQNRPSSFLAQRMDSLPEDMRERVRGYLADRQMEKAQQQQSQSSDATGPEGSTARKIRVPIMEEVADVGEDEKVSAAILAKVLEERAKERRKQTKFCIDVGTQTHSWHFPEKLYSNRSQDHIEERRLNGKLAVKKKHKATSKATAGSSNSSSSAEDQHNQTADVIQILRSISMEDTSARKQSRLSRLKEEDQASSAAAEKQANKSVHVSNILLASVIRSPPASVTSDRSLSQHSYSSATRSPLSHSTGSIEEEDEEAAESSSTSILSSVEDWRGEAGRGKMLKLPKSATFSALQTDL